MTTELLIGGDPITSRVCAVAEWLDHKSYWGRGSRQVLRTGTGGSGNGLACGPTV